MARNFVAGSSQHLTVDAAPLTALPLTISIWVRRTASALQTFLFLGDKDATNHYFSLGADGSNFAIFTARAGGTGNSITSSASMTVNVWYHLVGVAASATDRTLYLNGSADGTSATSRNPANLDRVSVGRLAGFSPSSYCSADIAEVAIWNTNLTAAEIAVLATGVAAQAVRPSALEFYAPLIGRHTTEIEIVGGLGMTVTGATAANHPRVFYPPTGLWTPKAGAGGGGGSPQTATPGVAALTLATFAPTVTVTTNQLVTPGVASLAISAFAPTVSTPTTVTPGVATLTITGLAPTVSTPVTATPGVLAIVITSFAPTVSTPQTVTPANQSLALTTFAPTVSTPQTVTIGVASLTTTGFAPTITVSAAQVSTPGTLAIVTTGFAPTIVTPQTITVSTASLLLTSFAPTASTPLLATPGTASLTTTPFAPAISTPLVTTPGVRELSITVFAPTVTVPEFVEPATHFTSVNARWMPVVRLNAHYGPTSVTARWLPIVDTSSEW